LNYVLTKRIRRHVLSLPLGRVLLVKIYIYMGIDATGVQRSNLRSLEMASGNILMWRKVFLWNPGQGNAMN
jgi:hypothetical protein